MCFLHRRHFATTTHRRHFATTTHRQHFASTTHCRRFATTTTPQSSNAAFDRRVKLMQRNWAASQTDAPLYDYVKEEIAWRLSDRLFDITRPMPVHVDLGCGRGYVSRHASSDSSAVCVQVDMSEAMIATASVSSEIATTSIVADEESFVFRNGCADVVTSCLSLGWINDLPGFLRRAYDMLVEDGAFIGAMFAGDTLYEMRSSLQLAEQERLGGVGVHVSPFVGVNDVAALLNQAGFKLLTLDMDEVVVNYPSLLALMKDLQGMAENSASLRRSTHLHRDVLLAADAIYADMYGKQEDKRMNYPATFQFIFMIGWKPSPTMLKPAVRGSATVSLKDIEQLATNVTPPMK